MSTVQIIRVFILLYPLENSPNIPEAGLYVYSRLGGNLLVLLVLSGKTVLKIPWELKA